MARKLQDYQALALQPNVRGLLDMIAHAEGADYNVNYGGKRFDTSKGWSHPRHKVDGGRWSSDAAGRYQFLSTTWDEVAGQLGIKDFSPANQDAAALRLAERRGVNLDEVAAGKVDEGTLDRLAPEWASLPTKAGKSFHGQPVKKSADLLARYSASAKGALPAAGATFQGESPAAPGGVPVEPSAGDRLSSIYADAPGAGGMAMPEVSGAAGLEMLRSLGAAAGAAGATGGGLAYLQAKGRSQGAKQRFAGEALMSIGGFGEKPAEAAAAPAPAAAPAAGPGADPGAGGRPALGAGSAGGPVVRSVSTSFDSGQPGLDMYWEDKQFRAVLPGRVKEVRHQGSGRGASGRGYGNFVVTESTDPESGKKVDVLYGHLDDVHVKPGDVIGEGGTIGKQGGTGRVISQDGTIASVDFLAPAPVGSGSMTPFAGFDGLRRRVARKWSK